MQFSPVLRFEKPATTLAHY